ncbi:MAG: DNA primase [Burkholderiaceae bacterium]|nr:DNA primase [Burkholderiaceae bacterium]
MIPSSFIADLLARTDVVEIVGRYVQLKKTGANFTGLCPFHGEKSPSFTVSPSKQFYHCFGCGANGTAISFLMEYQGMRFPEAVEELARKAGMSIPKETKNTYDTKQDSILTKQHQTHLTDLLAQARAFYRKQLRTNPRAIAYLKQRGLSGEIAAKFSLGYAPDDWRALEKAFTKYEDPRLVEAGLVVAKESKSSPGELQRYDRFRDRIMFPILNNKGEVIGFGGRVLDKGEPKYLNSPETAVFNKGAELYGLFEARQAIRERGYVLVTEGYMDVVALAQLGFPNTVATLGTATSSLHLQKLLRQTDHIVYSFDGDKAGRRAAWRALEAALAFAADDKRISFLFLPAEHDPDSFIRTEGSAAFETEINRAMPLSAFLIKELSDRNDLNSAEGRSALIKDSTPLLAALPNGALRLQILHLLADLTKLSLGDLQGLMGSLEQNKLEKPINSRDKLQNNQSKQNNFRYKPSLQTPRHAPSSLEKKVIDALLRSPNAYETVRDHLLIWREQLGEGLDDAKVNTLSNLITLLENALEEKRVLQTADLNAYAEQDPEFKNSLSQSMRAEAVGAETEDETKALLAACVKLQIEQLNLQAQIFANSGDLPALARVNAKRKNLNLSTELP